MTLLPCPFCGSPAEHDSQWWKPGRAQNPLAHDNTGHAIICSQCQASVGVHETEEEAVAGWNIRAALAHPAPSGGREPLVDGRDHLTVTGKFQSDKYPWAAAGFVPLKTTDPMARDLLATYAERRRAVDVAFADDLLEALGPIAPCGGSEAQAALRAMLDAYWDWCDGTGRMDHPTGRAANAVAMAIKALEQIADEQKVYKGHGDYDIIPALTADEAQSLARKVLSQRQSEAPADGDVALAHRTLDAIQNVAGWRGHEHPTKELAEAVIRLAQRIAERDTQALEDILTVSQTKAALAAANAEVERMRAALERAQFALNDWTVLHAPDMCGDEAVREAQARVGAAGTLAYISDVQELISKAIGG
jgi:Lar family restriction alleviation protein